MMLFILARKSVNWLKFAWTQQPIIFVSIVMGVTGPLIVAFSPWTKDAVETMKSIPRHYPYPQLQNIDNTAVDSTGEAVFPDAS